MITKIPAEVGKLEGKTALLQLRYVTTE